MAMSLSTAKYINGHLAQLSNADLPHLQVPCPRTSDVADMASPDKLLLLMLSIDSCGSRDQDAGKEPAGPETV